MDRAPNPGGERAPGFDGGNHRTNSGESTVEVDPTAARSETTNEHTHGSVTKRPLGTDEVYCWSCGVPVKSAAEICPTCGVRQQPSPSSREKSPGLAALASAVWVGAGQIYNGEIGRGIALMALMFVSSLSVFIGIGLVTTPLIWVYAVYDAYRTAKTTDQRGHTTMHNP